MLAASFGRVQPPSASRPIGDRWVLVAALTISLAALIHRRPDAFTMPWFYGEEGRDFYAQAWNEGWSSLFNRANGYLHLYPRLVANLCVTLAVPVRAVPWVNLAFVLLMMAVVWALTWRRFPGPPVARACALTAITLVPLGNEIWMTMTNIQWPMALIIMLLLIGEPRTWNWSHAGLLLLAGLTGPNALVLSPVAAWRLWSLRHAPRAARMPGLLVLGCGLVAALSLLHHGDVSRTDGAFNPADTGFVQAAFFQLWFPIMGKGVHAMPPWAQALLLLLALAGLRLFWRRSTGPAASQGLLLGSALFFFATMVAYRGEPGFLSPFYAGIRNFHLPAVLLAWALISRIRWDQGCARWASAAVLLWWAAQTVLFIGPKRFRESPARVDGSALAQGRCIALPIDPPGWEMRLNCDAPKR